ncbi:cytochrome P450 CYP82D47-like [Tasmannia lanceolata]|uniref:cytochrome P450 CYP82D47-like n=1 Tax=Tasmannia lanceolata TaxID=3420 RepID=UPI004063F051
MDFDLFLLKAVAGAIATLFLSFLWIKEKNKKIKRAPELPGWLPIIGHLRLLTGYSRAHRAFTDLAIRYGPIFTLRPGPQQTLVVSHSVIARECFTSENDRAFAGRAVGIANGLMSYEYSMFAFAPYGSYWREMRKIATTKILTASRLELLKLVGGSELCISMKSLYSLWLKNGKQLVKVGMNQRLEDLVFNIVMLMVAGKRYLGDGTSEADKQIARRLRTAAKEFNKFLGVAAIYNAIPLLAWLDLKGEYKTMKRTHMEMDTIVQDLVDDHRRRRRIQSDGSNDRSPDFIDMMLTMEEDGSLTELNRDTNIVIKATTLNLIIAGVENTVNTMVWMLSLLLNHPDVLEKVQAELDAQVGRDRVINGSDLTKLIYLQAIVKETLRLYPAAPLLVPHEAMEDCDVTGYRITRGTRLLVNAWMIHRDPNVWLDPEEFRPERFLTTNADVDLKGQNNTEYMPFGTGRRACPGMGFALNVMQLTLARALQAFDWKSPSDVGIDMEEKNGVSLCKERPLEVLISPRLPKELYI